MNKKILIGIITLVVLVLLALFITNTVNNRMDFTKNEDENYISDTAETTEVIGKKYLEKDENGIVQLTMDLHNGGVGHFCEYAEIYEGGSVWLLKYNFYDKDKKYFIYKNVSTPIGEVSRDSKIAISSDETIESVELVPIEEAPRYTLPIYFTDYNEYGPERIRPVCLSDVDDEPLVNIGEFSDSYNCPITECNGDDFESNFLMSGNCFSFYDGIYKRNSSWYGEDYETHEEFSKNYYIDASKNEKFVFGGYKGTQYESIELEANVEYYIVDVSTEISVQLERTQYGYFLLNCAELSSGTYYIPSTRCFIEII